LGDPRSGIELKYPLVIAHRGASARAPENTLSSISLALDLGADVVECDLRRTADGAIVLHHDKDVGGKSLKSLTYHQAQRQNARGSEGMPLLVDALKLFKNRAVIDLELKEAGYEDEILELVGSMLPRDRFICTSFLRGALLKIRKIDPAVTIGLIQKQTWPPFPLWQRFRVRRALDWCEAADCLWYLPHYSLLDDAVLKTARSKKISVAVWTVNDPATMDTFLADGRIAGLCTDRPDQALACRTRLRNLS
jgi:glycerophosphoryl diester phosphodiesterase